MKKLFSTAFLPVFVFLAVLTPGLCQAFPFLHLVPGEPLPPLNLKNLQTGKFLHLEKTGKPVIIVFWGTDIKEKEQHSKDILQEISKQAAFFDDRRVTIVPVHVPVGAAEEVAAIRQSAGPGLPLYFDPNRQAYDQLGLYVVPSVLLLDQQGRVVFGMGHSRTLVDRLKGEVEILLGEKTRPQVKQ